jgi:Flp pilus assembly protein TadD
VNVVKTGILCSGLAIIAAAGCLQNRYNREKAEKLVYAGLQYRKRALNEQKPEAGLRAMESFTRAVKADPGYGRAHMELGKQLLMTNLKDREAEESLLTALECNPDLLEARVHLVDVLVRRGKIDRAFAQQQELVEQDPSNPMHFNNLGQLYLQRKQWSEAVSAYRKALKLKPEYLKARQGLGMALWRSGDEAGGIALLREVVRLAPRDTLLRCELVRALVHAGLLDEAERHAKIAMELDPENGLVYHRYAEILVKRGRLEQAGTMARKALELGCGLSSELSEKISGFNK